MSKYNLRPSILEVDLDAIKYNVEKIKNLVNKDTVLMPVVKANSYGMGINSDMVNLFKSIGIQFLAVSNPDEGIDLRKCGWDLDIIVLNQTVVSDIPKIIDFNLTQGSARIDFIDELDKLSRKSNKVSKIHLEIDTGMGRVGIKPDVSSLDFVKQVLTYKNIELEGIYTHFSCSDFDIDYTNMQIEKFNKVIRAFRI